MSAIRDWLVGYVSSPDFLERYPYYAAILARLTPIDDPSFPWAAVSWSEGRLFLHVNAACLLKHPQHLRGILLHEVHHVVLGHLTSERFRGVAHPDLLELAMEASANEYIREPLPDGAVTCERHHAFGLRQGQSTLERYELLARARNEGRGPAGDVGLLLNDVGISARRRLPHGVPAPAGATDDVLAEAIAEVTSRGAPPNGEAGLLAGDTPGHLLELLRGLDEAPRTPIDWRTALQRFHARLRTPRYVYSWPNRRFPEAVGRIPGRRYRRREDEKPSILVAIDTSGSMRTHDLEEVARQLVVMADWARITVVESDATIQRVYRFRDRLGDIRGRGGTDLRPVFEPAFLKEHDAAAVVYFTDGDGPWPASAPPTPTLWVLTKGSRFDCPWGEKARFG